MIPKIYLLAFLSLQSSNARSLERDAALEGTVRFDVLNEPTTTFDAAASGIKKAIHEIEYLNSPKVQATGDHSQVPIIIPEEQDAVIQRGSKEINVIHSPPSLPSPLPQNNSRA